VTNPLVSMHDLNTGMIKTIRSFTHYRQKKVADTDLDESYILIHSLRDANLPKFLAEDVPLFESLLADLFPGMTPPKPDQAALEVRKSDAS